MPCLYKESVHLAFMGLCVAGVCHLRAVFIRCIVVSTYSHAVFVYITFTMRLASPHPDKRCHFLLGFITACAITAFCNPRWNLFVGKFTNVCGNALKQVTIPSAERLIVTVKVTGNISISCLSCRAAKVLVQRKRGGAEAT